MVWAVDPRVKGPWVPSSHCPYLITSALERKYYRKCGLKWELYWGLSQKVSSKPDYSVRSTDFGPFTDNRGRIFVDAVSMRPVIVESTIASRRACLGEGKVLNLLGI